MFLMLTTFTPSSVYMTLSTAHPFVSAGLNNNSQTPYCLRGGDQRQHMKGVSVRELTITQWNAREGNDWETLWSVKGYLARPSSQQKPKQTRHRHQNPYLWAAPSNPVCGLAYWRVGVARDWSDTFLRIRVSSPLLMPSHHSSSSPLT